MSAAAQAARVGIGGPVGSGKTALLEQLIPLGQTDGQRLIAALEPAIMAVAGEAMTATTDDLGGCAFLADIASMNHEAQRVRLFRS